MRCLFITRRPRHPWSKDEAIPAKITENEEAIGVGIRRQRQDTLGLGNEPLEAKSPVREASGWTRIFIKRDCFGGGSSLSDVAGTLLIMVLFGRD